MANNTGKKYGGREAGTPNKVTTEVKEIISQIIKTESTNISQYMADIEKPETKLKILIGLLPYVLPKQNHSNMIIENIKPAQLPKIIISEYNDNNLEEE